MTRHTERRREIARKYGIELDRLVVRANTLDEALMYAIRKEQEREDSLHQALEEAGETLNGVNRQFQQGRILNSLGELQGESFKVDMAIARLYERREVTEYIAAIRRENNETE